MSGAEFVEVHTPTPVLEASEKQSIWLFPKSEIARFTPNFVLREFHCRCQERGCHFTLVHPRLVESLQTLRERLARPLILSSAFRCRAYNRIVGGTLRSYHTRGMAADVVCGIPEELEELAAAAVEIPAVGAVGRYPLRAMVHIDVRPRGSDAIPLQWSA